MPQDDVCAFQDELSCEIVDCETKASEWTLMHRYNKATDLLEAVLRVGSHLACLTKMSIFVCIAILYAMGTPPMRFAWHCAHARCLITAGWGGPVLTRVVSFALRLFG